jgi:predicted secreted Zn-dependent protease
MAAAERIETRVREHHYAVTGSTARQIRAVMELLGPIRAGRRYGAYTDWEVRWRLSPRRDGELFVAGGVDVVADAVVTLPSWRRPSSASERLAAAWRRYLGALRRHEQAHVEIAEAAARLVDERLGCLEGAPSLAALEQAARGVVADAVARMRRVEREYDQATDHGRLQGVSLNDEEAAWRAVSSS